MAKTVIIAVCSAGAYLALVIGLTAYCSYRLLVQRKTRKQLSKFVIVMVLLIQKTADFVIVIVLLTHFSSVLFRLFQTHS